MFAVASKAPAPLYVWGLQAQGFRLTHRSTFNKKILNRSIGATSVIAGSILWGLDFTFVSFNAFTECVN